MRLVKGSGCRILATSPARPAYEFDKLPATATTDGEVILALARD